LRHAIFTAAGTRGSRHRARSVIRMAQLIVAAGVVGGLLSLLDPIPYVRDVLRNRTRPHRGTWLIWSVLACVALAAQAAQGGGWSLLVLGVQAASTSLILVLSIRRGVGGASTVEIALLVVAAAGLAGWALSSEPVVATLCVLAADLVGAAMMVPKTWQDPWSETLSTFWLTAGAALSGAVAVGALDAALLLYPMYFLLINVITASLILGRRIALGSRTGAAPALTDPA